MRPANPNALALGQAYGNHCPSPGKAPMHTPLGLRSSNSIPNSSDTDSNRLHLNPSLPTPPPAPWPDAGSHSRVGEGLGQDKSTMTRSVFSRLRADLSVRQSKSCLTPCRPVFEGQRKRRVRALAFYLAGVFAPLHACTLKGVR